MLIRHCLHAALKYTKLTKRIGKRGKANLGNKVRDARARHAAKKAALADAVVRTLYCTRMHFTLLPYTLHSSVV